MAILLVSYELKKPGRDYQALFDYLEQFNRCHELQSGWLIEAYEAVTQVREDLRSLVDANDVILVNRLNQEWSSYNYPCAAWLNDVARVW